MHTHACPDMATLRNLLDGGMSEQEIESYDAHIAECEQCQNLLQQLTSEPGGWTEAVRQGAESSLQDERALAEAIESLKEWPEAGTVPFFPGHGEEFSLAFLSPAEKEGELGRIAHYEVREIIGRGGMGQVFKAFDPTLNRFVAIKVIAPQLATSMGARRRFKREARAAAAISHEHVVAIHSVDEVQGLPYLVMEYVPGISLQERVDRDGPLELKEILRIGMQTAAGLAAAHAQGLVHRDIKPANILLENGVERVKLTDFGLARMVDDASLTQSGVLAGTPQYMAPEQARGEAQDHRVDLFSLGSVLYTLSTGHPPFRADSTMGVLRRVSDEQPKDVRAVNPDMPKWFSGIVKKLHAKKPGDRYQTAAEVADVLGRYLTHLQEPGPLPFLHPFTDRVRTISTSSKRWAAAAAAVLVLMGCLGIAEATGGNAISRFLSTVLRINTPQGTLVVEVDDPEVKVSVDEDGKEVTITGAGIHELKLRPGQHQWTAVKDGKSFKSEMVTIQKNGKEVVKVSCEAVSKSIESVQGLTSWNNEMVDALALSSGVAALSFTKDGQVLAAASDDGGLLLLELARNSSGSGMSFASWKLDKIARLQTRLQSHPAKSIAFSPDGRLLATSSGDAKVRVWDTKTMREVQSVWAEQNTQDSLISFTPDAKAIVAGNDWSIRLWDVRTGRQFWAAENKAGSISGIAVGPDGKTVTATSKSGKITLMELATGKLLLEQSKAKPVTAAAVSPDGKLIATTSADDKTVILDAATGKVISSTNQPMPAVRTLAFSPDGRYLASGSAGGDVLLWQFTSPRHPQLLFKHSGPVTAVAFSPDGQTLATGSKVRTVRLWSLSGQQNVWQFHADGTVRATGKPIEVQVRKVGSKTEILVEGSLLEEGSKLVNLLKNLSPNKDRLVNLTIATDVDYGTVRSLTNAVQQAGLRSSITATDPVKEEPKKQ